jgi:hypothetical protein
MWSTLLLCWSLLCLFVRVRIHSKFSRLKQRPPGKFTKASLAMKSRNDNQLTEQEKEAAIKAFEGLGLCTQLAEAAASLGWKQPSVIQQQAVPPLLQGKSNL